MRFSTASALAALLCLAAPASADLLVNVSKSQQRVAVVIDGQELYRWPISTGRRGHETPDGTFHPKRLEWQWYSRQYDLTPMPWSVFFFQGYALHGTVEPRNLGRAVSHGCVRLDPDNASILFSLVREQGLDNTKVVVSDKPLPRLRKAPPAVIAATERGATELRAAKAKPVEEKSAVAKAEHGEEKRPTAKAKHDDEVAKADHADLGRPVVMAKRDDEQAPAPKADLEIKVISAAKADRADIERPVILANRGDEERHAVKADREDPSVAKADREDKERPADKAERTAEAQPPAPQAAKLAEPPQQVVRLPEPAPLEARQAEPVHQDAQPAEPVQQEAKLAEPTQQDVRLPKPAPHRLAEPAHSDAKPSQHGDDAEVLRGREAWLRGLAHKYGFNKW